MTFEECALMRELTEALRALHDEQEGPPLFRREHQWQEAMDAARKVLARAEELLGL